MNKLTRWYLSQTPDMIFWICFLFGFPYLIWLFSIIHQLDKRRTGKNYSPRTVISLVLASYPVIYVFIFILSFLGAIFGGSIDIIDSILPFHFAAMLSIFLLLFITTESYVKYEKANDTISHDTISVFFMLWFYIFGIWSLQPKLSNYIKE